MERKGSFLLKVCLVLVCYAILGVGIACADFYFGEPVNAGPILNTPLVDGLDAISFDGLTAYITRGGIGSFDIFVSHRASTDEEWSLPENLGPPVNTIRDSVLASISSDGLELYFTDWVDFPDRCDTVVSRRATVTDPWGPPENLGPTLNTASWEMGPWISPDGMELYFNSLDRPGGYGSDDLWVSRRVSVNDPWGTPENLGNAINTSASETWPSLSPDGRVLLFNDSNLGTLISGGHGRVDIYVSFRKDTSSPWETPVNLGPVINSSSHDTSARISPDGSILYFASDRPGGFGRDDIYWSPILPYVDFNGDGIVDIKDLVRLIEHWGQDDSTFDIGPMAWGDGVIDEADLEVLMQHWGQNLDPNALAHWKLDEYSGTLAHDSARVDGSEDAALVVGGATWLPIGGAVKGALKLDGKDDLLQTPYILDPMSGPFSVHIWVKGGAPGQAIVSQAHGSAWLMTDPANGHLTTEFRILTGQIFLFSSETPITEGDWHHLAMTWDGTTRNLYADGELVLSKPGLNFQSSTEGLYIGTGSDQAPESFWDGMIDDVRIYRGVVTP